MVTITWSVKPNGLLTTTKNGNADFIVRAEYIIKGTDGTNTVEFPFIQAFDVPGESFTPFGSLTEEQVIGWAQQQLGAAQLAQLQLGIEKHLERVASPPPPIVEKAAPWSA